MYGIQCQRTKDWTTDGVLQRSKVTLSVLVIVTCIGCQLPRVRSVPVPLATSGTRVATVHFAPTLGNVLKNRERLVALTKEAAENGAQIVVHTEMATSGYAFFSREEISRVAETVPGPTTDALGQVAAQYGIYVVVGLPEVEPVTRRYYNSAVLIGPDGAILGTYHKRGNLLEASYNATEVEPVPTFDTPYGRLGIVICADMFYEIFPRLAAVAGAEILLAPANVGITSDFLRVRAFENDFAMIVANRYGVENAGSKPTRFSQESFTIPSPFPYDFSYDSRSLIVARNGSVLAEVSGQQDQIGYGTLPRSGKKRMFPVTRRPDLYQLIAQDTLESYTLRQFGLPTPTTFAAAAVDPPPDPNPWQASLAAAKNALAEARAQGWTLRLVVFPENFFPPVDPSGLSRLEEFSASNGVDLVLGIAETPPQSLLITSDGDTMTYVRTHGAVGESIPVDKLANRFAVIDRDYARVALLQDMDVVAPETVLVMEKMGVDVLAVNADSPLPILPHVWSERTGDYVHVVVANRQGLEGIYLGGYQATPSHKEGQGIVVLPMDTAHVRSKKEPRFFDPSPLLKPCGPDNC